MTDLSPLPTTNPRRAQIVYEGPNIRLEYHGPAVPHDARVVVAFPPFDYPFDAEGWGSRSFAKRDIAHVCVFHRHEDWHQHDEFLPAMSACRAFLGPTCPITAYGFSMGGYAAFLGARALQADRAIAVSPQYSIDPATVPFERRYHPQWQAMSGWQHDLATHMDDTRRYIVLFDPMHNRDRKHEAMLPKHAEYQRCLLHGVGHAGIQAMVEMGISDVFFDLMRGTATAPDLRRAYRHHRRHGWRYLRKVGTLMHERQHPMAGHFFDLAKVGGYRRLIKKWRGYHES